MVQKGIGGEYMSEKITVAQALLESRQKSNNKAKYVLTTEEGNVYEGATQAEAQANLDAEEPESIETIDEEHLFGEDPPENKGG